MRDYLFRHRLISCLRDLDIRGIRRIAHILPHILIPKPKSALVIKTLHGFSLKIDPLLDRGVENSIYYTGTYEKGTLNVMSHLLNDGDTFVDVGANIGLMSIYASNKVKETGKVIAFEPNPTTLDILNYNIKLNDIGNIETSGSALGNEKKSARIYDRWDSNRGSASLIKPEKESNSYLIDVIPLSSYLSSDIRVHLIKMDIEGYELEALRGALSLLTCETPPMLIIECSDSRENLQDQGPLVLYQFIKDLQHYRIFKSKGGKERNSRLIEILDKLELPNEDNIYCFTNTHLEQISENIFAGN